MFSESKAFFNLPEISFSITYKPTPSIREEVLLKYLFTNFCLKPRASNICAPLDNAAMIALVGYLKYKEKNFTDYDVDSKARYKI